MQLTRSTGSTGGLCRRYAAPLLLLASTAFLGACVSAPREIAFDETLISGEAAFGYEVAPAPVTDMLAMSAEMEAFLGDGSTSAGFDLQRFTKLMKKLKRAGYFENPYDPDGTYVASVTFAERRGNCMGYTNMFVALARASGLPARFQYVETKPSWNVEGDYLVRNNHINVLLENMTQPGRNPTTIVVDFNRVQDEFDSERRRVVSDAYAASLYYGNLAVDQLQAEDFEGAFRYLKRAILTAPENHALWNNLGVLYSSLERPVLAERAFEQALAFDQRDKTALSGLVVALRNQERYEEADDIAKRIRNYQMKRQRREAAEMLDVVRAET